MADHKGDFAAGATVPIEFNTNAATGASATYTGGSVVVYKDTNTTESSTGVTVSKDHDSATGAHIATIDTSADGTFYSAGSNFRVMLKGVTIDGKTVNAWVGSFSIANRPVQGLAANVVSAAALATDAVTEIAASVWNTLTSALTTSGSIGKALADFITYATTKLGLISANNFTVSDPFNAISGDITVVRGDSYEADTPRPILFESDDYADYNIASATFKAKTRYSSAVFSKAADKLSSTQFRVQLSSTETAAFEVGRDAYRFDLEGTTTGGDTVTLALGKIHVLEDVV